MTERSITWEVLAAQIDKAIATAREEGRREGLEMAAKWIEQHDFLTTRDAAAAIRALSKEGGDGN